MKRIALALTLLLAGVGAAQAQGLCAGPLQSLSWRFQKSSSATAGVQFTQPIKDILASTTDTSTWVALGQNQPLQQSVGANDSSVVGSFVVYVDSVATYAAAQATITATIDGAWLPQTTSVTTPLFISDANVASMASWSITPTTGAKVITLPLYANTFSDGSPRSGPGRVPSFVRLRFASSVNYLALRVGWAPTIKCQ